MCGIIFSNAMPIFVLCDKGTYEVNNNDPIEKYNRQFDDNALSKFEKRLMPYKFRHCTERTEP